MRENRQPDLSTRTSLGLGGFCTVELVLEEPSDFEQLEAGLARYSLPYVVMGAGTNILAKDGQHDCVLVRPLPKNGPLFQNEEEGRVRVGAGLPLPRLLAFCREHGLSGLEGLAGIPGSVGGSLAMNAGSFGCAIADCVEEVCVLVEHRVRWVKRADIVAGYREFRLSGLKDPLFLEAIFRFRKTEPALVAEKIAAHYQTKKERQPLAVRSAGCVFKNPANGPSAGVLLDRAGFRGKEYRGLAFSEKHANFLTNIGSGKASDAIDFLEMAREAVFRQFAIILDYEVRFLPCL